MRVDEISYRSLLEPFKAGMVVIDGFGEKSLGHISYDGYQNLTLDLIRVLDNADATHESASSLKCIGRAIGVLETGECATLVNLIPTKFGHRHRKHRVVTSSYRVGEMFVGDDVFSEEKFDGISVESNGLMEWMDQRPLKTTIGEAGKFIAEYTKPRMPPVTLGDGTALQIAFGYSVEHNLVPGEKFTLPQSASVNIRTPTPSTFTALYCKALGFNRLVMLLTSAFMPLTSIHIQAGGSSFGAFGRYKTYDVVSKIEYHRLDSLYTDMRQDFEKVVDVWFELCDRHEMSFNLYFNTWAQINRMGWDIRFLRIVQSLEAFDRENNPGRAVLRERLESLLEIPYNILETDAAKKEFVKYVTDTRNNYSHGDIQNPENPGQYVMDLARNTKRLEILLHANAIHALPIPDPTKNQIMESKLRQMNGFM